MTRKFGRAAALVGCGLSLSLAGCPAFNSVDRDVERTPVVNTGAGASIIYPGQTAPRHPGNQHPRQAPAGQPGQTPPAEGSYSQSGGAPAGHPAGGGGVTMIGGSAIEEERHQQIEEAPGYWKYITLPFAIVAAPFVYVYDAMRGDPEPGPPVPTVRSQQAAQAPPPGPPPVDYETQQLEAMERELARRAPEPVAVQPAPRPSPVPQGGSLSIADELAALRAGGSSPEGSGSSAAASTPSRPPVAAEVPSLATASGHVDRDGDGRTDHWIFRQQGQITRELFDENFDGQPDRTLHYDLDTHRVSRIEEDSDQDGVTDTWTSLRDGRVVGRRADRDEDGQVDTWTYYRDGVVTRVERDGSGNGFRDHVAHYVDGRLSREEKDDDGDGIPDLVTWYDEQERVARVEEDANGDGHLDVVSHYEEGRLKSRELRDASVLDSGAPR